MNNNSWKEHLTKLSLSSSDSYSEDKIRMLDFMSNAYINILGDKITVFLNSNQYINRAKELKIDIEKYLKEKTDKSYLLYFDLKSNLDKNDDILLNNVSAVTNNSAFINDNLNSKKQSSIKVNNESPAVQHLINKSATKTQNTFENFCVTRSSSNKNAVEYLKRIALSVLEGSNLEDADEISSSIFLYGSVGVGKTHLGQSVCNYIKKFNSDKKVLYIPSRSLIESFMNASRLDKQAKVQFSNYVIDLKEFLYSQDIIIIDDIHSMIVKALKTLDLVGQIMEEFSNQHNKYIILISNKSSHDLNFNETSDNSESIISRIKGSMQLKLGQPDKNTIKKYVSISLEEKGYIFDDQAIDKLSSHFAKQIDFRSVVSLAQEIKVGIRNFEKDNNRKIETISWELLNLVIHDRLKSGGKSQISFQRIIDVASTYYKKDFEEIITQTKKNDILIPRQIMIYLCSTLLNTSNKELAELFQKDDSTISNSISKIKKIIEQTVPSQPRHQIIKDDVAKLLDTLNN